VQSLINVYDGSITTEFTITARSYWTLTVDITQAPVFTAVGSGAGDTLIWMNSTFCRAPQRRLSAWQLKADGAEAEEGVEVRSTEHPTGGRRGSLRDPLLSTSGQDPPRQGN